MRRLYAGKTQVALAFTGDDEEINREAGALLFIEVSGYGEVVHDIVIIIQRLEELTLLLTLIFLATSLFGCALLAADDDHRPAIRLHGLERLHRNGMVDLAGGEVANMEFLGLAAHLIEHLAERRIGEDDIGLRLSPEWRVFRRIFILDKGALHVFLK